MLAHTRAPRALESLESKGKEEKEGAELALHCYYHIGCSCEVELYQLKRGHRIALADPR